MNAYYCPACNICHAGTDENKISESGLTADFHVKWKHMQRQKAFETLCVSGQHE